MRRVLENFGVGRGLDLFAEPLDRAHPVETAVVVRHEKFRRQLQASTDAPLAKMPVGVVRPVHQLLREPRGDPRRRLARLELVVYRRPPDAPEREKRHEDLDKDKRCAGVVEVHVFGRRLVGPFCLEVLDREVGQSVRHLGIAGRERVVALIADGREHREIHGSA